MNRLYREKSKKSTFVTRYVTPYRRYLLGAIVVLILYFTLSSSSSPTDKSETTEKSEVSIIRDEPAHEPSSLSQPVVLEVPKPQVKVEQQPGLLRGSSSSSSKSSEKARFAIATFTTQERTYTHLVLKNKLHYSKRHGYDFILDTEISEETRTRNICYHKLVMFDRLIKSEQYDWIWWVDFDTLITNTTISLESIVAETLADVERPEDIDFILNHDCNQLNAGSMLVRSSPSALEFLDEVNTYGYTHPDLSEQDAVRDTIALKKAVQPLLSQSSEGHGESSTAATAAGSEKKQVVIVPQWKINAFPEEIQCYDSDQRPWAHGMFLAHFAGAWAYIKGDDPYGVLMRKYEQQVIWE